MNPFWKKRKKGRPHHCYFFLSFPFSLLLCCLIWPRVAASVLPCVTVGQRDRRSEADRKKSAKITDCEIKKRKRRNTFAIGILQSSHPPENLKEISGRIPPFQKKGGLSSNSSAPLLDSQRKKEENRGGKKSPVK